MQNSRVEEVNPQYCLLNCFYSSLGNAARRNGVASQHSLLFLGDVSLAIKTEVTYQHLEGNVLTNSLVLSVMPLCIFMHPLNCSSGVKTATKQSMQVDKCVANETPPAPPDGDKAIKCHVMNLVLCLEDSSATLQLHARRELIASSVLDHCYISCGENNTIGKCEPGTTREDKILIGEKKLKFSDELTSKQLSSTQLCTEQASEKLHIDTHPKCQNGRYPEGKTTNGLLGMSLANGLLDLHHLVDISKKHRPYATSITTWCYFGVKVVVQLRCWSTIANVFSIYQNLSKSSLLNKVIVTWNNNFRLRISVQFHIMVHININPQQWYCIRFLHLRNSKETQPWDKLFKNAILSKLLSSVVYFHQSCNMPLLNMILQFLRDNFKSSSAAKQCGLQMIHRPSSPALDKECSVSFEILHKKNAGQNFTSVRSHDMQGLSYSIVGKATSNTDTKQKIWGNKDDQLQIPDRSHAVKNADWFNICESILGATSIPAYYCKFDFICNFKTTSLQYVTRSQQKNLEGKQIGWYGVFWCYPHYFDLPRYSLPWYLVYKIRLTDNKPMPLHYVGGYGRSGIRKCHNEKNSPNSNTKIRRDFQDRGDEGIITIKTETKGYLNCALRSVKALVTGNDYWLAIRFVIALNFPHYSDRPSSPQSWYEYNIVLKGSGCGFEFGSYYVCASVHIKLITISWLDVGAFLITPGYKLLQDLEQASDSLNTLSRKLHKQHLLPQIAKLCTEEMTKRWIKFVFCCYVLCTNVLPANTVPATNNDLSLLHVSFVPPKSRRKKDTPNSKLNSCHSYSSYGVFAVLHNDHHSIHQSEGTSYCFLICVQLLKCARRYNETTTGIINIFVIVI